MTLEDAIKCAPGIAKNAHHLATRGTGIMVTYWNNPRNQLPNPPWNHFRGTPYWQQEMAVLVRELAPEMSAQADRLAIEAHWGKLWEALEKIPIEQAIEGDGPGKGRPRKDSAKSLDVKQAEMRHRIWMKNKPEDAYKSTFCSQDICGSCKQIDCDCECHSKTVPQK